MVNTIAMGNILPSWGDAAEGESLIGPGDMEKECDEMHRGFVGRARIDHWSVVEWYRPLGAGGAVGAEERLGRPLLVAPAAGGGYDLLEEGGALALALGAREVAEFEDTLFCERMMAPGWKAAVREARPRLPVATGGAG